jgi:hypothetical protein
MMLHSVQLSTYTNDPANIGFTPGYVAPEVETFAASRERRPLTAVEAKLVSSAAVDVYAFGRVVHWVANMLATGQLKNSLETIAAACCDPDAGKRGSAFANASLGLESCHAAALATGETGSLSSGTPSAASAHSRACGAPSPHHLALAAPQVLPFRLTQSIPVALARSSAQEVSAALGSAATAGSDS